VCTCVPARLFRAHALYQHHVNSANSPATHAISHPGTQILNLQRHCLLPLTTSHQTRTRARTHTKKYIHTRTRTHIHAYMQTYTNAHTQKYAHAYTQSHTSAHAHTHTRTHFPVPHLWLIPTRDHRLPQLSQHTCAKPLNKLSFLLPHLFVTCASPWSSRQIDALCTMLSYALEICNGS
jgi:hypothetical protein